jgi:hypothetical protein
MELNFSFYGKDLLTLDQVVREHLTTGSVKGSDRDHTLETHIRRQG